MPKYNKFTAYMIITSHKKKTPARKLFCLKLIAKHAILNIFMTSISNIAQFPHSNAPYWHKTHNEQISLSVIHTSRIIVTIEVSLK